MEGDVVVKVVFQLQVFLGDDSRVDGGGGYT